MFIHFHTIHVTTIKKTKSQLEDDNRRLTFELQMVRKSKISEHIVSVINNLIKWGGLATVFYFLSTSIDSLAGEFTTSNIAISLVSDLKINEYLAYVLGAGGVGYGYLQRNLRRKTIERLHGDKVAEEKLIDHGRSSSKLTKEGLTRPEDK